MLNVWPVFVVGVETGLILAVIALTFVQFLLLPFLEGLRARAKRNIGRWP